MPTDLQQSGPGGFSPSRLSMLWRYIHDNLKPNILLPFNEAVKSAQEYFHRTRRFLLADHTPLSYRGFLLISFVVACVLAVLASRYRIPRKTREPPDIKPVLLALSVLVVPTTSRWPPAYITLARRAAVSHDNTILLSLSLLHASIKSGKVELRKSDNMLVLLLRDNLIVHGWRIRLQVEGVWWRHLRWWTIASRAYWANYQPDHVTSWTSTMNGILDITSPEARTLSMPFPVSDAIQQDAIPVLALDAIPSCYLPSFFRDLHRRSEKLFILTCVTRSSAEHLKEISYLLASIPFLFPRYSANAAKLADRRLQIISSQSPIHAIIEMLTSVASPFAVECIRNVSESYAHALEGYVERLDMDVNARTDCIKACGINGWREEKLWSTWEATLFSSGMLSRWVLVVSKQ